MSQLDSKNRGIVLLGVLMRLSVGDKESEVTARHDRHGDEWSDSGGGTKAVESVGKNKGQEEQNHPEDGKIERRNGNLLPAK